MLQNFIEDKTLNDWEEVLKEFCELTPFNYGEIWFPNRENNLQLSSNYYIVADSNQHDLELFRECSEDFVMSKGEGLPGRAFSSGESEWMSDVSVESEESFLRNKIAGVCGVKTGFAIPISKENEVLIVIAFFSVESVGYSSEYLTLSTDMATKILSF